MSLFKGKNLIKRVGIAAELVTAYLTVDAMQTKIEKALKGCSGLEDLELSHQTLLAAGWGGLKIAESCSCSLQLRPGNLKFILHGMDTLNASKYFLRHLLFKKRIYGPLNHDPTLFRLDMHFSMVQMGALNDRMLDLLCELRERRHRWLTEKRGVTKRLEATFFEKLARVYSPW